MCWPLLLLQWCAAETEAQQLGERSSDFTAATLVSWRSSDFLKEITEKESFCDALVLMFGGVGVLCVCVKTGCVWWWNYFISFSVSLGR